METLIEKIIQKLHSLPELKVSEVLDFVDFLSLSEQRSTLSSPDKDLIHTDEEFEAICDRLADEFELYVGDVSPSLSDFAISRSGIYEEHP